MNTSDLAHRINSDHPALNGHFPGQPIVPGVILLDRVLQQAKIRYTTLTIRGVKKMKFLQPLLPEQLFSVIFSEPTPTSLRFKCLSKEVIIAEGNLLIQTA